MAKVVVKVLADTSNLERGLSRAGASLRGFSLGFGQLAKGVLVVDAVQKAMEGLNEAFHAGISEFSEAQRLQAQTAAALKSTGNAANVSNQHIDDLALSLSNLSGVNDEVVKSGENMLLSFTHIRDQAGKNNDIFTRATKDILDYSVRTGKDFPQAAVLMGKALENPAAKVASLARVGVIFTQQQIKQIKAMQMSGNVLGAQQMILAKLEERYKGAAEAAGKTLPGQLRVLEERFRDVAGSIVGAAAPAVTKFVESVTNVVRKISEAHGAKAKLKIAWEGIEDAGRSLFDKLKAAVDAIDWNAVGQSAEAAATSVFNRLKNAVAAIDWNTVWADVQSAGASLSSRLNAAVSSVDWAQVARTIIAGAGTVGRQVGDALTSAMNAASQAIRRVDWGSVGKDVADGLVAAFAFAVAAVGNFIRNVDWVSFFKAFARLQVDAIKAMYSILWGAGKELGRVIVKGIAAGFDSLINWMEQKFLQGVLAVLQHLNVHVGRLHLFPGLSDAIDSIDGKLKALQQTAKDTRDALAGINPAVRNDPALAGPTAPDNKPRTTESAPPPVDRTQGLGPHGGLIPPKPTKSSSADSGEPKWKKAFDLAVERLQLAIGKTGLTASINDDIAATQSLITYLQSQVALHKSDLSIQGQLVDAQKQMLSLRKQLVDAAKQEVDAIKQAALARLDASQQKADTGRAVRDARASLATAKMLGGPIGIRQANEALADALRAQQRMRIENSTFRLSPPVAGSSTQHLQVGNVVINIHSNESPERIANEVLKKLQKRGKQGASQHRGTIAGRNFNVGIN